MGCFRPERGNISTVSARGDGPRSGDPYWERARDRQGGLPKIIDLGLQPIIYTDDDLPGRVRLTAYGETRVVTDPNYAFGQQLDVHVLVHCRDIPTNRAFFGRFVGISRQ